MPPDAYHDLVDDSVFTNVAASLSIHMANYTACLCGDTVPDEWYDVANKLHLMYDEEREYHPEYQGYSPGKSQYYPYIIMYYLKNTSNYIHMKMSLFLKDTLC